MTTTPTRFSLRKREAFVLPCVTWEQYEAIARVLRDLPGLKFRYLDGVLEIMPVSEAHEEIKSTIARLLEAFFEHEQMRFYKRGGPSYGDQSLGAMSEPDESYNLGSKKAYPDLVIEVVITSGGVDKLEGYRRMGVTEVWFWEDGVLDVYALQAGQYAKQSQSELLPNFPLETFCRYVTYHDQYDAVQEFRQTFKQHD